jgi:hypothetical protein
MLWVAILVAVIALLFLAAFARKRRQNAMVEGLRAHFPHIARMRLVSACPGLEPVLQETELRMLFDWILLQLYGRTGSPGFRELIQWTLEHGEAESLQLIAEVTRDSVDHLSAPVLAVIDGCEGRTVAAVLIDQSLTEAGQRAGLGSTASSTDYFGRPE